MKPEIAANRLHISAVTSLLALICLGLLWESLLAPIRPGGSWMVFKVVPLLLALKGVLKRDVYTMQWSAMLVLLYFTEGVVRSSSDINPVSVWLALAEIALSLIFFVTSLAYLSPFKKAAKAKLKAQKTNLSQ